MEEKKIDSFESVAGNYTRFLLNNEEFAIKTDFVERIIEKPVIRIVPKSPEFIEGIANIEGRIVPVLNPFVRFNIKQYSDDIDLKLLLINLDNIQYGIITEEIVSNDYFDKKIIEAVNPLVKIKQSPFINGIAKFSDKIIYLLDLQGFIFAGFEIEKKEKTAFKNFVDNQQFSLKSEKTENSKRYLVLSVSDEDYCFDIARLENVVSADEINTQTSVESTDEYVIGFVHDSDKIIPVIDLQKKFELTRKNYDSESRIAILDINGFYIGIIANSVREIINIRDSEIREASKIFNETNSPIKSVGILNNGDRLVMLLNEENILNTNEMEKIKKILDIDNSVKEKTSKKTSKSKVLMLVFTVGKTEFAIKLNNIDEVINSCDTKVVPRSAIHIRGIFSHHGEIVTAVDLSKRLGIKAVGDEKYFIIINLNKSVYGLIADSVQDIISVEADQIKTATKGIKGIDTKYTDGILTIENSNRTPIVLNIEKTLLNPGYAIGSKERTEL